MFELYLWLKWAHIVSVMCWMAGLLYLPRLFVYHAACGVGVPQAETFKIMERRLYRAIMTPAMAASWIFGLGLAVSLEIDFPTDGWFWIKVLFVIVLSGFHIWLGRFVKSFSRDEIERDGRFFRVINEVPTVIMLVAVFLVVFKPF